MDSPSQVPAEQRHQCAATSEQLHEVPPGTDSTDNRRDRTEPGMLRVERKWPQISWFQRAFRWSARISIVDGV